MWCYRPPNWARLDPNERCAPPLPTLGDLKQHWCQSCSNNALKVVNPVSNDYDTHLAKPLTFSCVHTQKFLNRFLSRVSRISFKIRRPKTSSLVSKFGKTTKIPKTKTSLIHNFQLLFFCIQNPSILIKGPRLINLWLNPIKKLSKIL